MSNRVMDEATVMWRSILEALADGKTITKKAARASGVEALGWAVVEDCGWLSGGVWGAKHMPHADREHPRAELEGDIVAYVEGLTEDPVAHWEFAGDFSRWEDNMGAEAEKEIEDLAEALHTCGEWKRALQVHPDEFWAGVWAGLNATLKNMGCDKRTLRQIEE